VAHAWNNRDNVIYASTMIEKKFYVVEADCARIP
jgi:hypothetical protein